MTRGESGSILSSDEFNILKCPAFNTKIVDKVGSGDALLSIYSICKFAKVPDDISIFFASVSAAKQTEIVNNQEFLKKAELLKNVYHLIK